MNARTSMFVVAVVAAMAGGCGSKKGEAKKGGEVGAETMGTFTCATIEKDACVGPTDTFAADVPKVHVTYKTKDLPAAGEAYTFRWVAEDVGAAAPANTVVATLKKDVTEVPAGAKNYVVNGELSKPTAGWPVGKYKVEIERAGKVETTAHFSIK